MLVATVMAGIAEVPSALASPASVPLEFERVQTVRKKRVSPEAYEAMRAEQALYSDAMKHCSISVVGFADARPNKLTIGTFSGGSLIVDKVDKWLGDVEASLMQPKLQYNSDVGPKLEIKLYLSRLYTRNIGTNLYGISALRAHVFRGGSEIEQRHFRGVSANMNVTNSANEHILAVNKAVTAAVDAMASHLPGICMKSTQ